jgi:hypothetical protein
LTWIHLTPCIIDGPWLLFFLEKKICLEQKKKQLADVFSSRSLLVLDFGALDGIIVVVFFFHYHYELLFSFSETRGREMEFIYLFCFFIIIIEAGRAWMMPP